MKVILCIKLANSMKQMSPQATATDKIDWHISFETDLNVHFEQRSEMSHSLRAVAAGFSEPQYTAKKVLWVLIGKWSHLKCGQCALHGQKPHPLYCSNSLYSSGKVLDVLWGFDCSHKSFSNAWYWCRMFSSCPKTPIPKSLATLQRAQNCCSTAQRAFKPL